MLAALALFYYAFVNLVSGSTSTSGIISMGLARVCTVNNTFLTHDSHTYGNLVDSGTALAVELLSIF